MLRSAVQRYLVCAVALTMLLTGMTSHGAPTITLTNGGKLTYALGTMSAAPSRTTAASQCKNKGAILPSDYVSNIQSNFATSVLNLIGSGGQLCVVENAAWNVNCYGAYTAGTANYGSCTTARMRTQVSESNWDTGCNYRWTQGWFGRYSDGGYVGVDFWQSTWAHLNQASTNVITNANVMRNYNNIIDFPGNANIYLSGALNGYTQGFRWNASYQCYGTTNCGAQSIPPHGNLYIALGARNTRGVSPFVGMRVDVPESATADNTPFARSNYVLMCQWQGVENGYYQSTPAPSQYPFVQGWKSLTWAQSHWWVIFIIVAAVILIILFAILIYCCCTRKPLPEGERINSMSMREREGSLYVVMDEEVDEEIDEDNGTVRTTSVLTNPRFESGNSDQFSRNPLRNEF